MIRIILCDDHKLVREGIKQIIQGRNDFEVLEDASSGEALFKVLHKKIPDVLLLDISLPGRGGLEVLKQVKVIYPQINVLVLSMYPEDQFAIRMLKAGASGYLHKDSPPEILLEAIKTVATGEKYLSKTISSLLCTEILSAKIKTHPHEHLSDREFEVLLLLGEGKKNNEIAESLSLSVKTISTYKTRIFEKMRFTNQADIIRYLFAHNLLTQGKSELTEMQSRNFPTIY